MSYQYCFLDYETFNLADLKDVGVDNYSKHPSAGISCLGWALDIEEVVAWLPHLGPPPRKLIDAMRDPRIIKIAWNSAFEYNITRYVLPKYLSPEMKDWFVPLEQWRDPIVLAHNISLPGRLEVVAQILKSKEQKFEHDRAKTLKKMFCQPQNLKQLEKFKENPEANMTLFGPPQPFFRNHETHPKEFLEYVEYCKQDVRAERELWYRLLKIPFPEIEWKGFLLDQRINEFGMPANRKMGEIMLQMSERFVGEQYAELKKLTGLKNPNSDSKMKKWLAPQGYPWGSVNKTYIQAELDNPDSKLTPLAREVLLIRKSARKSSYKKLVRFLAMISADDRLRWQFKYMAAARTGRWAAGKTDDTESSVMVQNFSRGEKAVKKRLQHAIDLIMANDYDGILRDFTDVPDKKQSVTPVEVCITLLRSLFQAKPGKKLVVADKNAIENRMLGWAAGCKAILDVFRTCNDCGHLVMDLRGPFHCPKCGCKKARDPYLAFGTNLYNKTYAEMWADYIGGNEEPRQMSKPPVLGAGYCLGGGEMYKNENGDMIRGGLWGYAKNVCGVDMPKELAHKAVDIFRKSYPEVVQFWTDLEEAFKQVLLRGGVIKIGEVSWDKQNREWVKHPTTLGCIITFRRITMEDGKYIIRMELPSGRALHYIGATIESEQKTSNKTGRQYTAQTIYYEGVEHSATETASGQRAKKQHRWGKTKTYGGKICLAGDTPIVTNRGLIRLDRIQPDDLVWDGLTFVHHGGILDKGIQEVGTWMGLKGTANHQILVGNSWQKLNRMDESDTRTALLLGQFLAPALCYLRPPENTAEQISSVNAEGISPSILAPSGGAKFCGVRPARAQKLTRDEINVWAMVLSRIKNFVDSGSIAEQGLFRDAPILNAPPITTTADEELLLNRNGVIQSSGLSLLSLFRDGIIQLWTWIESIMTVITSEEISDWWTAQQTPTIGDEPLSCDTTDMKSRILSFDDNILRNGAQTHCDGIFRAGKQRSGVWTITGKQKVYDLMDCGPHHRFAVMTDAGIVFSHNCENAIQAMARDDLLNSMFEADKLGFHLWGLFHDELGAEEDDTAFGLGLDELNWCLYQIPRWAPGLLLGSEGYIGQIYKKG